MGKPSGSFNAFLNPFYSFTVRSLSMKISSSASLQEFTSLCNDGRIRQAYDTFKVEIWSDPSLFSHLLQSCIKLGSLFGGKQVHSLIITSGGSKDKFISNHLLNLYSKLGQFKSSLVLFSNMPRRNLMSFNILINGYLQLGDLENAQKLFDEMSERNIATWNAMIAGLTQFEFNKQALSLFKEMYGLGFLPDEFTLGSVLRGCAGLRSLLAGQEVHACLLKCGFELSSVVGSSLAHMYIKSGSLSDGEKLIKSMPIRTVVAWNTLIAGKAQNGCPEEVLNQYNMMKMAGFRPDKITFVSVLSACSELATLGQGQQIHAEVIKAGASSVLAVISSLISMYSRSGCLEDSIKAFVDREDFDVVLWSSMIAAYGFHGRGEEAVELFHQMEDLKMEANEVTFLSLLYACSHSGLKEKGTEYLDLMVKKYKLKPRIEHYTCVVDLLGRAGRLEEAEGMIRSMPVKPDGIIWKTLLAACKLHKEAEMAKRISEEIIKLDPLDAASYVLLSNIHASARNWPNVSEIRKAMRDRNVRKEPGISWLELKNLVHQFSMGDKSHPQYFEIDLYLKELMSELKRHGYVPDLGSVLHDMDNEEKEYNLAHHSEKFAIAFALMNTSENVPIRVMKNLRVCNDCHNAIKCISRIRNREIIVRDASRFHHFKDGECSCGNYW
ncbi:pentatricopeptide repeat-containing protein At2g41080 isoform X1 [Cucumis melo]|uniref:Pentatricopeptide repeat-containing protein At2g41080 isoform X1 n=1 Tax=Cucumis melo TaxID=3656 RepID=A0A1S3C1T8_CUCME|nr:pentatricopeptide repeat-containing protein At2g41080 isoform X1 [Cucumis melo]